VYASDEAREKALEKAEKLQSDLDSDHPIFIKTMLQSHVTGGFWLVISLLHFSSLRVRLDLTYLLKFLLIKIVFL
jgi:hypothetical protein